MKQFFFQIVGLLAIIFLGMYLTFNKNTQTDLFSYLTGEPKQGTSLKLALITGTDSTTKASIKIIDVADTPDKRAKGLSGRSSLASDSGVLFKFEKPDRYKFWMKGVSFPLDMIWIAGTEIVDISHEAKIVPANQPATDTPTIYQPSKNVDQVLEVNGGVAKKLNINIGDKIEIK